MPEIFVSYSREDGERVRHIVEALRKAGFKTWWDRDIPPSAPWERTIEDALDSARVMIVCWSPSAVSSEMVRAEARQARAKGKLIQIFVRPCEPPLFFGERQGVDLIDWPGDPADPRFRVLTDALLPFMNRKAPSPEVSARESGTTIPVKPAPVDARWKGIRPRSMAIAAVAVLAMVAAVAWLAWPGSDAIPTIAVIERNGDRTVGSESGIATDLNRLASVHPEKFVFTSKPETADYQIAISSSAGTSTSADVTLLARDSSELLWSASIEVPEGMARSPRPTIVARLNEILLCAFGAGGPQFLSYADQRLFLGTCDTEPGGDMEQLVAALSGLSKRNPDFGPVWAKLAIAEAVQLANEGYELSSQQQARLLARIKEHVARAQSLGPLPDDTYIAEALLVPPDRWVERLAVIDNGIKAAPRSAYLHVLRGEALAKLGRMRERLDSLRRAIELNPLSPTLEASLATALLDGGATELGWKEIEKTERLWPGLQSTKEARFYAEFRYGSGPRALHLFETGETTFGGTTPWGPRPTLQALADPTPDKVAAAITWLTRDTRTVVSSAPLRMQNLTQLGQPQMALEILSQPGALEVLRWNSELMFPMFMRGLHDDPAFLTLASRLGLVQAWQQTGHWPDFCDDVRLPYDCSAVAARSPAAAENPASSSR